jgi:hypothetical protein
MSQFVSIINLPFADKYSKGEIYLFLQPNNHIINDDTYFKIVNNIPKEVGILSVALIEESKKVKEQFIGLDLDVLELIRADAIGTVETAKFMKRK